MQIADDYLWLRLSINYISVDIKFYCFPGVTSVVMIDSTGQIVDIKIEYIPLHLIKL